MSSFHVVREGKSIERHYSHQRAMRACRILNLYEEASENVLREGRREESGATQSEFERLAVDPGCGFSGPYTVEERQ
jgi:hypothetical protein